MRISDWSSDVCSSDLDDPKFVIGKVERSSVFVPRSPRIGTNEDNAFDLARLGCLHLIGIEETSQDAGDPLDLALLAANEMADARHYDFEIGRASGRERGCQYV